MDETDIYDALKILRTHGVDGTPDDVFQRVTEEDVARLAGALGLEMPAAPERDDETGSFTYTCFIEGDDRTAEGTASTAAIAGLLAVASALATFGIHAGADIRLLPDDE